MNTDPANVAPSFTSIRAPAVAAGSVRYSSDLDSEITLSTNGVSHGLRYVDRLENWAEGWTWITSVSRNGFTFKDSFADDQSTRLTSAPAGGNFNSIKPKGAHGFQQINGEGLIVLVDGEEVDLDGNHVGTEISLVQSSVFLDPANPENTPVAYATEVWSIENNTLTKTNSIVWLGQYEVDASYMLMFTPSDYFDAVVIGQSEEVSLQSSTGLLLNYDLPDTIEWQSDFGTVGLNILESIIPGSGRWLQRDGTGSVVQGKGYASVVDGIYETSPGEVWSMSGEFAFNASNDISFAVATPETVLENTLFTGLTPSALDPEGTPVTLSIAAEGDGALFALDADGELVFNNAPDFEVAGDADGDNIYDLVLLASDGVNETRLDLQIMVENTNEVPVIAELSPVTMLEGTILTGLTPLALDPEGTPVTLSIAAEGDGALFALDADGELVFNNPPDFEVAGDADGDNIYDLALLASDGVNETRVDLQITVEDVNPEIIYSPSGDILQSTQHDNSDTELWDRRVTTYDELGDIYSVLVEYDAGDVLTINYMADGSLETAREDFDESASWDTMILNYDNDRNLISREVIDDSGDHFIFQFSTEGSLTRKTTLDSEDKYIWAERSINYDESGKLSGTQTVFDDGDIANTYFDEEGNVKLREYIDAANDDAWEKNSYFFDTTGVVSRRETIFDDGSTTTVDYL